MTLAVDDDVLAVDDVLDVDDDVMAVVLEDDAALA
jgi:hypothetical protein